VTMTTHTRPTTTNKRTPSQQILAVLRTRLRAARTIELARATGLTELEVLDALYELERDGLVTPSVCGSMITEATMCDYCRSEKIVLSRVAGQSNPNPRTRSDRRDADGKMRFMSKVPSTASTRRRAERDGPARTADDRTVLVGMNRPATPGELRAFVAREQARIRTERGLPPAA
jgi:hypothetical protein